MWERYAELGFTRLIYANTSAVLTAPDLVAAIGGDPEVTVVLLRSNDETARDRLAARASGAPTERDIEHSAATAVRLDATVGDHVRRIDTDGRTPREVAQVLLDLCGWARA